MMNYRHFGPRFERGEWNGPRFFGGHRGYGRPDFEQRGGHGHHHHGQWQGPTAEQQVLRSTAMEVARLFAIAARTSFGDAEKQAQLRGFLERSRKELLDLISAKTQSSNETPKTEDNAPEVAQA